MSLSLFLVTSQLRFCIILLYLPRQQGFCMFSETKSIILERPISKLCLLLEAD